MSWEASGFIKKQLACADGAQMSRGQKLLLLVLADYHDTKRKLAYPSVKTLAEECLSSLAQTKRDLAYLEEHLSILRSRDGSGRGSNYTYKFVGLDLSIDEARRVLALRSEGVHGEPLFSAAERGSHGAHKGFTGAQERGSEGVHGCNGYKEEPKPTAEPMNQKGAAGAMATYAQRADGLRDKRPELVGKLLRITNEKKGALTGSADYDGAFKRLVLAIAEECRIPPPVALALWGYDEQECAAVDQSRAS